LGKAGGQAGGGFSLGDVARQEALFSLLASELDVTLWRRHNLAGVVADGPGACAVSISALGLFVNLTTWVTAVRGAHAAEGARLQAFGGSGHLKE
jgi:hypothetical protein